MKNKHTQAPLLLDKPETADLLGGVCLRSVDNLVRRGLLHPVKILRRTLFRYSEVAALARRGTGGV